MDSALSKDVTAATVSEETYTVLSAEQDDPLLHPHVVAKDMFHDPSPAAPSMEPLPEDEDEDGEAEEEGDSDGEGTLSQHGASIVTAVLDWSQQRRQMALQTLLQHYNPRSRYFDQPDIARLAMYDNDVAALVSFGMLQHVDNVHRHRKAVEDVYQLLLIMDKSMEKFESAIEGHDLSMLTEAEAYGYTRRRVHGDCPVEYQRALSHHHAYNRHHPEHYGWTRNMDRDALQESLIDLLATRLVRDFPDGDLLVRELFLTTRKFLRGYTPHDRRLAKVFLEAWAARIEDMYWTDEMGQFDLWEQRTRRDLYML